MEQTKEDLDKESRRIRWKEYYEKNKERLREKGKAYHFANRATILQKLKEYHKRPEAIARAKESYSSEEYKAKKRAYARRYRKRPEVIARIASKKMEIVAYKKEYYLKNKDYIRKKAHNHYHLNAELILIKNKEYRGRPDVKKRVRFRQIKYMSRPSVKERAREFQAKYCNGEMATKRILEIEKNLDLIKEIYSGRNVDAQGVAEILGTSGSVVLAVLRRNGVPIKSKAFSSKKCVVCSNGLKVRSNFERSVAEWLINQNLTFVYEPLIRYGENNWLHPDFYVEDKNLYVECAGLMDKEWYRRSIERKKNIYSELNLSVAFIDSPSKISEVV